MISQRDAQGQHEVEVKHRCLAGEIDRLKIKGRLGGQGTDMRQTGVRVWGPPKITLESIYRGLFLGQSLRIV